MARRNGLTAKGVAAFVTNGRYPDGNGLYLQVSGGANNGVAKSWLYRFSLDKRARWMGLGPYPEIGLAEARQLALEASKLKAQGIDPIEARRSERSRVSDAALTAKADAAKRITFAECAEKFISANKAAWRNTKHQAQWPATLKTYAYPFFGDLAVGDIDLALVLKALEPIWKIKPETAGRVRGRIERVLAWAAVHGYRSSDNPARWRGNLDAVLPPLAKLKNIEHHPALPYAEMPSFMEKLRAQDGIAARALEFLILTAARTGEVIGAKWNEIDTTSKVWTVPPERMKAGREHRVPLCARALEIINALPRVKGNSYLFPGQRKGKPLSDMAMLVLLRRMNREDITSHGFRSSFRDWAAERTGFPREVAEMALAHNVGSAVEQAYRRSDLFEKRRRLINEWAKFCVSKPKVPAGVVPMRPKKFKKSA